MCVKFYLKSYSCLIAGVDYTFGYAVVELWTESNPSRIVKVELSLKDFPRKVLAISHHFSQVSVFNLSDAQKN